MPLSRKALEERVEPGDGERDAADARARRVRLDEEPGVLVDLPEHLVPDATVRGPAEEPRVPIDARVEIGYRNTGEEVGDRAQLLRSAPDPVMHVGDTALPLEDPGAL